MEGSRSRPARMALEVAEALGKAGYEAKAMTL
jgi:hypothetical protein